MAWEPPAAPRRLQSVAASTAAAGHDVDGQQPPPRLWEELRRGLQALAERQLLEQERLLVRLLDTADVPALASKGTSAPAGEAGDPGKAATRVASGIRPCLPSSPPSVRPPSPPPSAAALGPHFEQQPPTSPRGSSARASSFADEHPKPPANSFSSLGLSSLGFGTGSVSSLGLHGTGDNPSRPRPSVGSGTAPAGVHFQPPWREPMNPDDKMSDAYPSSLSGRPSFKVRVSGRHAGTSGEVSPSDDSNSRSQLMLDVEEGRQRVQFRRSDSGFSVAGSEFVERLTNTMRTAIAAHRGSSRRSPKSRSTLSGDRRPQLDLTSPVVDLTSSDGTHVRRPETMLEVQLRSVPWVGEWLADLAGWWCTLQEPRRTGLLPSIILSKAFQSLSVAIILANVGVIVYSTNDSVKSPLDNEDPILSSLEFAFLVFYCCEFGLRLLVHRLYFFINEDYAWNWLDFVLVICSWSEFLISPTYLRSFRFLKISKIARMFRALRFVNELRVLLDSLTSCFVTMMWSLIMLLFLLGLFAIYFVQMGTSYASSQGDNLDEDFWAQFTQSFGSVQVAMFSLFSATTGVDWMIYYQLTSRTGSMNGLIFAFFIMFFLLAVYNIVMSVFLDKAMKAAAPTLAQSMQAQREFDREYAEELLNLLVCDVDRDSSGLIEVENFMKAMKQSSRMKAFLSLHGLDIKDSPTFFNMVASSFGREMIDYPSFISACVRLRGNASSLDLNLVSFELKRLAEQQRKFEDMCGTQLDVIYRMIQSIAGVRRWPHEVPAAHKHGAHAVAAQGEPGRASQGQGEPGDGQHQDPQLGGSGTSLLAEAT